jgi:feruloyl-CoA synthase
MTSINLQPAVQQEIRADGSRLLDSAVEFNENYARCVGEWLEHWARETPQSLFLAQRDCAGDWQELSYGEVRQKVIEIASWLSKHKLSADRPVVVLSDNGVEHALLMLAAMHIGIPICAVSPGYSLLSQDHRKLKAIIEILNPGVVFADSAERFVPALNAIAPLHDGIVVAGSRTSDRPHNSIAFSDLMGEADEDHVLQLFNAVTPDTIAKLLFTSGSTGIPKAVINTQRMLCSSQMAKQQVWPFLTQEKPVLVEWLPWSHTFGTNHNFNLVLCQGGSFYIDEGKPAPGLIDTTVKNLKDISPSIYFSVPRAYEMLVPLLQQDEELKQIFFKNLKFIFYAAAALPQHLWESLQEIIDSIPGCNTMLVSAWGSTETSPLATDCHFQAETSGNIGIPVPGTTLKLIPNQGKLEVRIKGPNVTPGYWKNPDETSKAFDEEGYYCIGDAVKFIDPDHPERGLMFDGRIAEDFKLLTGTWVHVGCMRLAGIDALKPVAQDIVVAGHNRDNVGFLIFPSIPGCRALCPDLPEDTPITELLNHPNVQAHLQQGLDKMKAEGGGSSNYAARALLMEEPPSLEAGEITDKGYINQRFVLERRAELVEQLFA